MRYRNRLVYWVVAIFIVFSFVTLFIAICNHHHDKKAILASRMECYADLVAQSLDLSLAKKVIPQEIRVTVMSISGEVISDSEEFPVFMNNHADRPEIIECIETGDAYLTRLSESLGVEMVYYAKMYGDKIIRVSQVYGDKQKRFMYPDWSIIVSLILLLIISVLTIFYVSRRYKRLELIKKEKEASKIKQEMTRNISHELKTPVSSLQAYLETIVNNPDMDAERRQHFIERAFVQALKLTDIISDISFVTKLEEVPGKLKLVSVNLKVLFADIVEELSADIALNNIRIVNELDSDNFSGSYNLIYAILRNLLENAVKYAGEGSVVKVSSKLLPDGSHELDFHDNGRGVPEDTIDKIFDRFYRISSDMEMRKEGSGLGLTIVRNSVLAHKGEIHAYHVPGGGLGFRFILKDLH